MNHEWFQSDQSIQLVHLLFIALLKELQLHNLFVGVTLRGSLRTKSRQYEEGGRGEERTHGRPSLVIFNPRIAPPAA
jgi:hypothetical protein